MAKNHNNNNNPKEGNRMINEHIVTAELERMELTKEELDEVLSLVGVALAKVSGASEYKIRKNSWTYEDRKNSEKRAVFLFGILTKLNKPKPIVKEG